jgi:hypothetical protein
MNHWSRVFRIHMHRKIWDAATMLVVKRNLTLTTTVIETTRHEACEDCHLRPRAWKLCPYKAEYRSVHDAKQHRLLTFRCFCVAQLCNLHCISADVEGQVGVVETVPMHSHLRRHLHCHCVGNVKDATFQFETSSPIFAMQPFCLGMLCVP